MKRRTRQLVAALSVGLLLGALVAPPAGAEAGCEGLSKRGNWTTIAGPAFPGAAAPQTLRTFAIAPRAPETIWASNGASVMVTRDGGCSWSEVFALSLLPTLDVPISAANSSVTGIVVPEAPAAQKTVYLVVEEHVEAKTSVGQDEVGVGPAPLRPHVVVSRDGGRTWRASDEGLPVVGDAQRLRVAPSDPSLLYLLVGGALYASQDAGNTWSKRGDVGGADFHVDPVDPQALWFWGGPLKHSTDGGRSAAELNTVPGIISHVDVFRSAGSPSRIMVFDPDGGGFFRSDDGGATFVPDSASPSSNVISLAHGATADNIVLSVHGSIHRYQAPGGWVEITPGVEVGEPRDPNMPDIFDLQVDRTNAPSVFGRTATSIERYDAFSLELPPLDPVVPPVPDVDVGLTPAHKKIKLAPGETRTIDYRLRLPAQPTPLDVFFLVDTTASMQSSINGLARGIHRIVGELSDAGIDVAFGVGEYKDYPIAGYGSPINLDFPYRRNRAIGPADASLVAAIERMEANGGGELRNESQLTALFQAASGVGEPGCTEVVERPPCVPPGQDAGFRGEAYKVLVNITDAGFEDSPQHPSPPFDTVARELEQQGVLQVGLAVYGQYGMEGKDDLMEMARATGTLAPTGGVDCDEDGVVDVPAGGPLVCEISDEISEGVMSLAPAILASLRAITDLAPVKLTVTRGEAFVGSVTPEVYPSVNVKEPSSLDFAVTYRCPSAGDIEGSTARGVVDLVASLRDVGVGGAGANVVCSKDKVADLRKEKDQPVPPAVPPIPVTAAAIAPVPPPPPAPATNTQPQPNPHVQAAAAHQEQEQAQVALANAFSETEESYAFSRYDANRSSSPATLLLYMSALSGVVAAGALSLRRRVRTQFVRR